MGLQLPRCRSHQVYARQRALGLPKLHRARLRCRALYRGYPSMGSRFTFVPDQLELDIPPTRNLAQTRGAIGRAFNVPGAAETCAVLDGGGAAADCLPAPALTRRRGEPAGLVAFAWEDFFLPGEGFRSLIFAACFLEDEDRALVEARSQALWASLAERRACLASFRANLSAFRELRNRAFARRTPSFASVTFRSACSTCRLSALRLTFCSARVFMAGRLVGRFGPRKMFELPLTRSTRIRNIGTTGSATGQL
jgi:hypothetical protein